MEGLLALFIIGGVFYGIFWFASQFPVLTIILLLLGIDCGGDD